jgi:AcrR family transcriptional regulator
VTVLVVLDDWLLAGLESADRARLTEVVSRMTVRQVKPPELPETDDVHVTAKHDPSRATTASTADGSLCHVPSSRRNPAEVRSALLRSASASFRDRGYAATSHQDIASAAHTSKSVLYRHFRSKSSLLIEAVLEPFINAFLSTTRRWTEVSATSRTPSQPESIADLYQTLIDHHLSVRLLMGVVNDPANRDVHGAVDAALLRMFTNSLSQQRARRTSADDRYEPALRMRAVAAMLIAASALDDWLLPHGSAARPTRDIIAMLSALVSAGRTD